MPNTDRTVILDPGLLICIHSYNKTGEHKENHDGHQIHVTHYKCAYCSRKVLLHKYLNRR